MIWKTATLRRSGTTMPSSGTHVIPVSMEPGYNPPSASMNPDATIGIDYRNIEATAAMIRVGLLNRRRPVCTDGRWTVQDWDDSTSDRILAEYVAYELDRVDPLPRLGRA